MNRLPTIASPALLPATALSATEQQQWLEEGRRPPLSEPGFDPFAVAKRDQSATMWLLGGLLGGVVASIVTLIGGGFGVDGLQGMAGGYLVAMGLIVVVGLALSGDESHQELDFVREQRPHAAEYPDADGHVQFAVDKTIRANRPTAVLLRYEPVSGLVALPKGECCRDGNGYEWVRRELSSASCEPDDDAGFAELLVSAHAKAADLEEQAYKAYVSACRRQWQQAERFVEERERAQRTLRAAVS